MNLAVISNLEWPISLVGPNCSTLARWPRPLSLSRVMLCRYIYTLWRKCQSEKSNNIPRGPSGPGIPGRPGCCWPLTPGVPSSPGSPPSPWLLTSRPGKPGKPGSPKYDHTRTCIIRIYYRHFIRCKCYCNNIYTYMYTHTRTHTRGRINTDTNIHTDAYTHTQTNTHGRIHTQTRGCNPPNRTQDSGLF
jgi:hypothetical protein